jgi:hypothetical protein
VALDHPQQPTVMPASLAIEADDLADAPAPAVGVWLAGSGV